MSPCLQYLCCYFGHQSTFAQGESFFETSYGISVSDKQIERVCHHYGEEFEKDYVQGKLPAPAPAGTSVQSPAYVMMDGGMILTREQEHPWKEIKPGRIFNSKDLVKGRNRKRSVITNSVYVSHLGGHEEFLSKLDYFIEDIPDASKIFIADGAKWIWKRVDDMYPDSVQILDFFHAKEHLCQFAGLHFTGQHAKTVWIKDMEELLLKDGVNRLIRELEDILTTVKKKAVKDVLIRLISYCRNNRKRMLYRTFKEKGYLIGSGPMESAIRSVVQQRLKLSGQRWTITGGQQLANIRTVFLSKMNNVLKNKILMAA